VLILFILVLGSAIVIGRPSNAFTQEANPEAFKIMKKKAINPETELPKTLDPSLFKGKAKKAYEVAKEISTILAQVPCFCECEAYGHENLLDCFIDNHGAG